MQTKQLSVCTLGHRKLQAVEGSLRESQRTQHLSGSWHGAVGCVFISSLPMHL